MEYPSVMTRSMTAYGQGHVGPYLVEIHSVNRKGLEINIYLPRELLYFDIAIARIDNSGDTSHYTKNNVEYKRNTRYPHNFGEPFGESDPLMNLSFDFLYTIAKRRSFGFDCMDVRHIVK